MGYRKRYGRGYAKKRNYRRRGKGKSHIKTMMGHVADRALSYASSMGGATGVLARNVLLLKNLVNAETKYLDTTGGPSAVSNAVGSFGTALNLVQESSDYNGREGRSIINDSITVNWILTINASATNTFIRCMIVSDKKPDVSAANIGDVIGSSGDYLTQIDKEKNGDRFVILKNWLVNLSSVSKQSDQGKIYLNLKGTHTTFSNTTTGLEKNRLIFFAISNEATNTPTIYFNCRFRYRDN